VPLVLFDPFSVGSSASSDAQRVLVDAQDGNLAEVTLNFLHAPVAPERRKKSPTAVCVLESAAGNRHMLRHR
jgi:hypothetical protein